MTIIVRQPAGVLISGLELSDSQRDALRDVAGDLRLEFAAIPQEALPPDVVAVAGRVPDPLLSTPTLRWNHVWSAGTDATLTPAMRASHVILTSSAGNGGIRSPSTRCCSCCCSIEAAGAGRTRKTRGSGTTSCTASSPVEPSG